MRGLKAQEPAADRVCRLWACVSMVALVLCFRFRPVGATAPGDALSADSVFNGDLDLACLRMLLPAGRICCQGAQSCPQLQASSQQQPLTGAHAIEAGVG